MKFFRQTKHEMTIAALLLLLLPVLAFAVRLLDPTTGRAWDWLSVMDTALQAWRVFVAAVIGWGVMRILFPTLAEWVSTGGFRQAFQTGLTDPRDHYSSAIAREAAWRRCKLALFAMAFSFAASLTALLLF